MTSDSRALPTPSMDVVFSAVSDGAVLLCTRTEVYFGLNEVGALVWELLSEAKSLEDMLGRLAEEYPDVAPEDIETDVTDLLRELVANELVQPRERSAA